MSCFARTRVQNPKKLHLQRQENAENPHICKAVSQIVHVLLQLRLTPSKTSISDVASMVKSLLFFFKFSEKLNVQYVC